VKITSALAAAAAVAAAASVGIIGAPIASADDPTITTLGSQAKLVDGNVVQGWTISNLKTSTDVIPHVVDGTLWEATATDQAIDGGATPIVSNLNARARSGQTYRVLFGAATPQGVNPSTLAQGEKTTGKVYFDVTGDTPDSVVYNAGGQDVLVWVQPPPQPRQSGGSSSGARGQTSPAAPAATTPGTPAPAGSPAAATGTEGAPLPAGAPLPSGSAGTPLPAGTPGTPVPAGTPGTPVPAGSQGTPLPAGTPGAPVAANSEGAPLPASVQEAPAVAPAPVSQGTPLPAGSEGTPVAPTTTTVAPRPPS
jgi:uncharacterized protein DUF1942